MMGSGWLEVRMCNKSNSMNVTLSVVSSLYMLFAVSSPRLILALQVYIDLVCTYNNSEIHLPRSAHGAGIITRQILIKMLDRLSSQPGQYVLKILTTRHTILSYLIEKLNLKDNLIIAKKFLSPLVMYFI